MTRGLWEWSNEELAEHDILFWNLIAARDLPCAQAWDYGECRRKVSAWVVAAQLGTENCFRRYRWREAYRDLSDSEFRMLVLSMVLRRNLGVWYNLTFMDDPYDARDSCNTFLHGILSGRGGSCVSMPVVLATIGRRLGYPVHLVHAKYHTFCRWGDPSSGEWFNIEATSPGFATHPDSHYMEWPHRILPVEVDTYRSFMLNLTPREELAFFMGERGMCWFHHLEIAKAVDSFFCAYMLQKNYPTYHQMWGASLIVQRIFGPQPTDLDAIDPQEINLRADSLQEFEPWMIRHAQMMLEDVISNWRTGRPPFPEPRLSNPELSPQFTS